MAIPYWLRYFSRAVIAVALWPYWLANSATVRSGDRPDSTSEASSNMFRPRRMNEMSSKVLGGVAPWAVAFFSTAGPRPCAIATSSAEADGAACSDEVISGGSASAAGSAPATASVAAAVMATIRRRGRAQLRFTEFSCH